jgi:hypothetical protein
MPMRAATARQETSISVILPVVPSRLIVLNDNRHGNGLAIDKLSDRRPHQELCDAVDLIVVLAVRKSEQCAWHNASRGSARKVPRSVAWLARSALRAIDHGWELHAHSPNNRIVGTGWGATDNTVEVYFLAAAILASHGAPSYSTGHTHNARQLLLFPSGSVEQLM